MRGRQQTKKTGKRSDSTLAAGRTEVVNVRIPKDLILELDYLVEKRIFNSRSEAIREFAREYVQSQLHDKNAKGSGRGGVR